MRQRGEENPEIDLHTMLKIEIRNSEMTGVHTKGKKQRHNVKPFKENWTGGQDHKIITLVIIQE